MNRVSKEYNDFCIIVGKPKIADNVWIGYFTLLDGSGGLIVEENVSISSGAQIITHSTHVRTVRESKFINGRKNDKDVLHAPVKIERGCFIGSNAVVLMGVTIGHHSIIGAGTVVTKDVPPYSMVTGVPGKVTGSSKKFLKNDSKD
ncbi:acyltransferase [Candidatus Woesearchaeota archaeon]|nr:acyltransferase [Candidatus Woesearchaeota archaeon]